MVLQPAMTFSPGMVKGEGDARTVAFTGINKTEKPIKEMLVDMLYMDASGVVEKEVPNSQGGFSSLTDGLLQPEKKVRIEESSFFMLASTKSLGGRIRSVVFEDGSKWPDWSEDFPEQSGDMPVSGKVMGVIGEAELSKVVAVTFNHSDKPVQSVRYRFTYLDASGKPLGTGGYGANGTNPIIQGKAYVVITGSGKPVPGGAASVSVDVTNVRFADKSEWELAPPPTPVR